MFANRQLNIWKCFYILLIVCYQEMEFWNFFSSFLLLLVIFGLHFARSPLFCCLQIYFPTAHFGRVKCWAVNLLLHYLHPNLHLIYPPVCNPMLPDYSVQTWLRTWQRPWKGPVTTPTSSLCVPRSHKSLSREMDLENLFLPAAM